MTKEKQFMIIEKNAYEHISHRYSVYENKVYNLTQAIRIMLALDTLNEDRKTTSYHLQEVNFSMVEKPLVLNEEVKEEDNQEELPF